MKINPKFELKYFKNSINEFQNIYFEFDLARQALSYIALIEKVPNPKIAMPSFICDVVPKAFLSNCWDITFFEPKNRYQIALDDLDLFNTNHINALLIPHYFGMLQNMNPIEKWCKKYNIILIEDCAHLPLLPHTENMYGCFGDYAIYSMRKFHQYGKAYLRCNKNSQKGINKQAIHNKSFRIKDIIKDIISNHINLKKIIEHRKNNIIYLEENIDNTILDSSFKIDKEMGIHLAIPFRIKKKITKEEYSIVSNFGYVWPSYFEETDEKHKVFIFPIHQSLKQNEINRMLNILKNTGFFDRSS